MSEEKLCPECGKPFGTNPDCIYCRLKIFEKEISGEPKKQTLEGLERLVEDGPKTIKPPQGPEARKKFEEWLKEKGLSAPADLLNKAKLLYEMLCDYLDGKYKGVPWRTIAMVIFALLYVINPFDLIPDFIPGVGWIDDAAVERIKAIGRLNVWIICSIISAKT